MVATGNEKADAERIRELIRVLNQALDNCNKLLAQAEREPGAMPSRPANSN